MPRIIKIRNKIIGIIYSSAVRKICFRMDAEKVHNFFIKTGIFLGSSSLTSGLTKALFHYSHPALQQKIKGIRFPNPVGISAGFDKNASLLGIIGQVGFGFAEIGSITAKPCSGNPGIRLKRITEKNSILVNLGLNNNGARQICSSLEGRKFKVPYGVNIAKTNSKETADNVKGLEDYIFSLKECEKKNIGDYYTLNISCPNAYGGLSFHKPSLYALLLKEVSKLKIKKPIFVKLSPDIGKKNINKIIKLSYKYKISGFVCSNVTKDHDFGKGGLSGKAVEDKSNELLSYIYKKTKGDFILIGVGGIFSAEDAYKKIRLGANLVQMITGMIYKGPSIISDINIGLVELLKQDRLNSLSESVGADIK